MTRVVMGLLFEDSGRILIARRSVAKKYGGLWEFPGGKMEGVETIEEALKREIMEELSAPIQISRVYPGYICSHGGLEAEFIPVTGCINPSHIILNEHEACRFISVMDLRNFDFSPLGYGAIEMIEQQR